MHRFLKLMLISIGISALFLAVVAYTYAYTKRSYNEVGFNDGQIHANTEVMKKIREVAAPLKQCNELAGGGDSVKLIEVKSEAIYIMESSDNGYLFCE